MNQTMMIVGLVLLMSIITIGNIIYTDKKRVTITQNLNANGHTIQNLGVPVNENDAARLVDIQDSIAGIATASTTKFAPYQYLESTNVQGAIQQIVGLLGSANATQYIGYQGTSLFSMLNSLTNGTIPNPFATQSPIQINNNYKNMTVGGCNGLKVCIYDTDRETGECGVNPIAGNDVALYTFIDSGNGRKYIWGANPLVQIDNGNDAAAWGIEVDVNNSIGTAPDPYVGNHKLGIDVVSGGLYAPSSAYSCSMGCSGCGQWKYAMYVRDIGNQPDSAIIHAHTNINSDFGLDFYLPEFKQMGIRLGKTVPGKQAGIGIQQLWDGQDTLFLQRNIDSGTSGTFIRAVDTRNSTTLFDVDTKGNLSSVSLYTPNGCECGFLLLDGSPISLPGKVSIGGSTLPPSSIGTPAGFLSMISNGTNYKIPFYPA